MKAEIIGNIGADAQVKEYGGKEYVTFNIADTIRNSTTKQNETTWVSAFWYGNGGGLLPYLTKGSKLFIRGELKVSTYTDTQTKQTKQSITINISELQLINSTKQNNTAQPTNHTTQLNNDLPF